MPALHCYELTTGYDRVKDLYSHRWVGGFGGPMLIRTYGEPGKQFRWGEERALPFLPCWPGLLVDSAVFTLPWLAALLGIPAIRRLWRRRRQRCPACAYDLRSIPAAERCPECGEPRRYP